VQKTESSSCGMPPSRRLTGRRGRPMDEQQHEPASGVKVPRFSAAQERTGEIELSDAVFGCRGPVSLLHEAVRMQLANRRSGTAATKTRGLISGGGRKPWRQKGTGRARAGSTRSPLWRHGGTIFGPQRRDYSYKMPRKAWRRALTLALSDRALNGKMIVVEALELAQPKTKLAKAALDGLGLQHALIVLGETDRSFYRAARNLAAHKVLRVEGLNVFDVLNFDELLMTENAARAIEARLGTSTAALESAVVTQ
jgi:large subunit ribosomal protein L4